MIRPDFEGVMIFDRINNRNALIVTYTMQKRKITNHNDKYVVFFDFADEQGELDAVEEPLEEPEQTSQGPSHD